MYVYMYVCAGVFVERKRENGGRDLCQHTSTVKNDNVDNKSLFLFSLLFCVGF